VSELALSKCTLASLISVLASLYEGYFVVPPGEVTPVRLQVFFEFTVLFRVLTNTQNNLLAGDSFLLRGALVPLSFLVVEGAYGAGYINNGTVLSVPVFLNDTSESEVVLVGHEVDTTFG
jgi:hypothetical protein